MNNTLLVHKPRVFKTLGNFRTTGWKESTGWMPNLPDYLERTGIDPLEYYKVQALVAERENTKMYLCSLSKDFANVLIVIEYDDRTEFLEGQVHTSDLPNLGTLLTH